jgi:hypothetical protein
MKIRVLALALTLGLLGLPAATPATASGTDPAAPVDAYIVVGESDLSALLDSGLLGDYAIVEAADVGLDVDALVRTGLFSDDTILTPATLGLDDPQWGFFPFFSGFGFQPFVRIRPIVVPTFNVAVPFFAFRPRLFFNPVNSFFPFRPFRAVPAFGFGRVIIVRGF